MVRSWRLGFVLIFTQSAAHLMHVFTDQPMYSYLRIFLLFAGGFCLPAASWSQSLIPVKRVPFTSLTAISVTQYGNLLTSDRQGTITLYDTAGAVLQRYASPKVAPVTLLEGWQTLRVFAFHREIQAYTLLDRWLAPVAEQVSLGQTASTEIGYARVATLAADNQLWIFDDTDFSIKKYDPATRQVALRVPLELILNPANYQVEFMREYQNLLFLVDRNYGILVFDNMGNLRRKLAAKGNSFFGFTGNEIYFIEPGRLRLLNLYTGQERYWPFPANLVVTQAVIVADKAVLVADRELIFCLIPIPGR